MILGIVHHCKLAGVVLQFIRGGWLFLGTTGTLWKALGFLVLTHMQTFLFYTSKCASVCKGTYTLLGGHLSNSWLGDLCNVHVICSNTFWNRLCIVVGHINMHGSNSYE